MAEWALTLNVLDVVEMTEGEEYEDGDGPRATCTRQVYVCMYICMVITYSKGKDQPGKVTNPGQGQLDSENDFFPVSVRA